MDNFYNRVYSDTERNIMQNVFRKLIFVPSISLAVIRDKIMR